MKNVLNLFGVLGIAALLFTSGCTDACKDVDCGTNGTCIEGECDCDTGYEGTNCETRMTAKYVGSYNLSETCTETGTASYTVTIAESSTEVLRINFTGLWTFVSTVTVYATLGTDGNSFTIPSQVVGTYTVSGTGTRAASGTLSITYSVVDSSTNDTCTATLTKQ